MRVIMPKRLVNQPVCYFELAKLMKEVLSTDSSYLDFYQTVFIQPNMFALVALMLHQKKKEHKGVKCVNISKRLLPILKEVGFLKGMSTRKQHIFPILKFTRTEQKTLEDYFVQHLGIASKEESLHLLTALISLFDLTEQDERVSFVSGYCNLNEDWLCLSVAIDEVLFVSEQEIIDFIRCGQLKSRHVITASIFIEEIIVFGGKVFVGCANRLYLAHNREVFKLEDCFNMTFITVLIPLQLFTS